MSGPTEFLQGAVEEVLGREGKDQTVLRERAQLTDDFVHLHRWLFIERTYSGVNPQPDIYNGLCEVVIASRVTVDTKCH